MAGSTFWHKMEPGLSERSTANLDRWSGFLLITHIKKKTQQLQKRNHNTEVGLNQLMLIKIKRKVIIHAYQTESFFHPAPLLS